MKEPTKEEKEFLHALYELTAEALKIEPGELANYMAKHKMTEEDMPKIDTEAVELRIEKRRLR